MTRRRKRDVPLNQMPKLQADGYLEVGGTEASWRAAIPHLTDFQLEMLIEHMTEKNGEDSQHSHLAAHAHNATRMCPWKM